MFEDDALNTVRPGGTVTGMPNDPTVCFVIETERRPRLAPGGILLCDDYGFDSCPGATRAVDEFLRDKPEKAISLSDGAGFFIKDCVTRSDRRSRPPRPP